MAGCKASSHSVPWFLTEMCNVAYTQSGPFVGAGGWVAGRQTTG